MLLLCCIKESVSLVLPGSGVMPEKQMMPIFWPHLASFALAVGFIWHHLLWQLASFGIICFGSWQQLASSALAFGIGIGHPWASFAKEANGIICISGHATLLLWHDPQANGVPICLLSLKHTNTICAPPHDFSRSRSRSLSRSLYIQREAERGRERASARARASEIERCLSLERFTCSGLMPDKQNMPITLVSSQKTH